MTLALAPSGPARPDYRWLDALKPRVRAVLIAEELLRRRREDRLAYYRPYARQKEFHEKGARFRERLFMAGNQLGKTFCGASEVAFHLTGRYPSWWRGKRFDGPVQFWAGSKTSEVTRDSVQKALVGPPELKEAWGSAAIPKRLLVDWSVARGTANALSSVVVRHVSGGLSTLGFKSYDQGREKWQSATLHGVWMDEEPPADIYTEAITRTNATNGITLITFTPLLGMSEIVRSFLAHEKDVHEDQVSEWGARCVVRMTIYDVDHYTDAERQAILAQYPEHERDARAKGVPMLGSGKVFPVPEDRIVCEPFQVPRSWPVIGGIDFGWDHPTAAVKLAWDRDADVVYVVAEYRVREATPLIHAGALRGWGKDMPWAWPHDGMQTGKGDGAKLAKTYKEHGLKLLADNAKNPGGGIGIEAGVMMMLERMQTGRLKFFRTCPQILDETRFYHRLEGKIVPKYDDLLSACRYGIMMLRFSKAPWSGELPDFAESRWDEFERV